MIFLSFIHFSMYITFKNEVRAPLIYFFLLWRPTLPKNQYNKGFYVLKWWSKQSSNDFLIHKKKIHYQVDTRVFENKSLKTILCPIPWTILIKRMTITTYEIRQRRKAFVLLAFFLCCSSVVEVNTHCVEFSNKENYIFPFFYFRFLRCFIHPYIFI